MFKRLLLSLLLVAQPVNAAISGSAVWEIRTGGASTNSGGFDSAVASPGTDYSQQNSAQYNATDLASSNATTNPCVVTSASHNFVSTDNGNFIHITGGTNFTAGNYLIASTSGNAATLDRACGTSASASAGTYFVGGAYKLGNAFDTTFFSTMVAGNTVWIKNDGSNHSTTVNNSPTVGTATALSKILGYKTTRGDNPTGTDRPVVNVNSAVFAVGFHRVANLIFFGSASTMFQAQNGTQIQNSKFTNNAAIVGNGRNALNCTGNCSLTNIEAISWNGSAVNLASGAIATITGSYLHDSNRCLQLPAGTSTAFNLTNSVLAGCQLDGINITSAVTNPSAIIGNTIYGFETPIASTAGIRTITGSSQITILNNIIYGFATAMSNPDAKSANFNDYNNFYNNTADISTWAKGDHSYAVSPAFQNVSAIRGTNGSTSGQTLTDSGANFSSVTDNADYVYISSNTGGSGGSWLITGHTTTTLTLESAEGSPGTGSSTVYEVRKGHNWAPGPLVKWKATPAAFTGSSTTSYLDLGGAQRHEYGKAVGK